MDAYAGVIRHRRRGAQPYGRIPSAGSVVAIADAGIGKSQFDHDDFAGAENTFQHLLGEYPKSDSSAEAAYYLGVSRYKRTHSPAELKKTVEHLQRDFPQSEWARRASVYQML